MYEVSTDNPPGSGSTETIEDVHKIHTKLYFYRPFVPGSISDNVNFSMYLTIHTLQTGPGKHFQEKHYCKK